MKDISPITVARNPAQAVASVVKLFGFRVRGNTVYVFFSGLVGGVFCAMAVYPVHIVLAGIAMVVPPILSGVFIRKFISDKPNGFFWFWLDERIQGRFMRKPARKGVCHD